MEVPNLKTVAIFGKGGNGVLAFPQHPFLQSDSVFYTCLGIYCRFFDSSFTARLLKLWRFDLNPTELFGVIGGLNAVGLIRVAPWATGVLIDLWFA